MKRSLPVVDYQKGFVDGALGFPGVEVLDRPTVTRIATCRAVGGDVALTLDTHGPDYLDTQRGWRLSVPHCLLNSEDWQFYDQTGQVMEHSRGMVIGKGAFPSPWLINWLKEQGHDRVELIGLVSYLCIFSNAIMVKAALPGAEIMVDASCTAGSDPALYAKDLDATEVPQITVLNR